MKPALRTLSAAILAAYPVCILAADATPDTQLPTVQVNSQREQEADGYQATKTRVGKVLEDPQDIPQALTSVTKSLMHDQQVASLREALRNVSGLTFNAAEGGRSGDNMMLRGFYTFGDIYLDGIRDTAQYNRETFNLEQVDVLRGSAAMLFGRGQAGGVINQVSKTPKLGDSNVISGTVGEESYRQFTADFNKKLGETVVIRLNVMDRDEENKRENPVTGDHPELKRQGLALSLGFGLETDRELILSHIHTKTRDNPDYGVRFNNTDGNTNATAALSAITRSPTTVIADDTFFGNSNTFDDSDTAISTAVYTHKFSPVTEWRTQIRLADYERAYWAKTPSSTLLPTANASAGGNQTRSSDYKTTTVQSDFNTKLDVLGMQHTLLGGVEYLYEKSFRTTLRDLDPTAGFLFAADQLSTAVPNTFKGNSYSVYGQDSMAFLPQWDLLLGTRHDKMDANYSSATSPQLSYGEWSYRTALSYHQSPTSHYYVSYSNSFSPTADLYQLTVVPLPPERSNTLELGAKWLLLDGDLSFCAALYRTDKDWERNTDLDSTATILTKKRRTDGFELELAGHVTDNWEVFSGLALMDARILEVAQNVNATTGVITNADPRLVGQRARNTPTATFNLWTTYKLNGYWKVGGGVEAKGARYGYNPTQTAAQDSVGTGFFRDGTFNPNRAPGYARWDAMLAYEEQKWAVRLNVKNVFDKQYYDALYDNGAFVVPGNGRTAILSAEFKF
ncbi:MAG: TonB-dependent receptor domain-containing protein [Methylophilaceae bacterium]